MSVYGDWFLTFYVLQLVVTGFSLAASLSVILTLLCFREMRINRPFMRIIAYISFSDFLGNVAYLSVSNRPADNSPGCVIEAFLNVALYPCSWMWTVILVYCLYTLAIEKKVPNNFFFFHCMTWPIPIIFFLISIPFSTYRAPTDRPLEVCTIGGFAANIYHDITYYGLLFICLGIMLYLYRKITKLETEQSAGVMEKSYLLTKSALFLYPILLFICWLPHIVTVFVSDTGEQSNSFETVFYFCDLCKISHGFFTGVIFFTKSQEARKMWKRTIYRHQSLHPKNKQDVEERTTSDDFMITENCLRMRESSLATKSETTHSLSSRPSDAYGSSKLNFGTLAVLPQQNHHRNSLIDNNSNNTSVDRNEDDDAKIVSPVVDLEKNKEGE
jgi:hypothetical protein